MILRIIAIRYNVCHMRKATLEGVEMLNRTQMQRERLISLSGAGVRRGGRWLVRGVDLDISRGEIVTLIGPNGSGKSTTARTAIGVIAPSEGRVERLAGLRIGYVPQKLAIDWTLPLTVERLM
jgi:zinc transport system ATP-binding protein